MNHNILSKKNCLITGAAGGIGTALTMQLLKNNCNVFLTSKNKNDYALLKNHIADFQENNLIAFQHADLTKINDIKNLISTIRKKFGSIDILINSAGLYPVKPLSSSNLTDFDNCFDVNVRAPFLLSQEFSKDMIKKHWGRLVFIGSSSSYSGFENNSIYCSSKHAILGFSRSIFQELKKHNVRSYCISPRGVKTSMHKNMESKHYEKLIDPKDLAKFIVDVLLYDNTMICTEVQLDNVLL